VFHSFRHTFVTALERAQVPESAAAQLVGHRYKNFTFGVYGGKLTPRDKLELIKGIDFGVSLDHLIGTTSPT
jgi:integrase